MKPMNETVKQALEVLLQAAATQPKPGKMLVANHFQAKRRFTEIDTIYPPPRTTQRHTGIVPTRSE